MGACEVGDGVAEGGSWSWRAAYEGSSEGSVGVRVNLEVEVFDCLEGVVHVGVDLEGRLLSLRRFRWCDLFW
ncbi:hypothetical protein NDU88_004947 [Pleurodeles waltl]|uniref:Uncharacterized protein n=1 Tax=Pleurodeles waltl TaxID=8319 RepID=A0AAV7T9Y3_PLEWA|nr:hypothetical protein NDU88_004947 [Pleurodeles waltl]